jgi:hypothetical protein
MRRFQDDWRRFGQLPALAMVSAFFVLTLLATLVLDDPATTAVGLALFAPLVLYCFARRRGGWDVFASAAIPGATATLLHDIVGTPRWIGALLIPVALLFVWHEDRDASSSGGPAGGDTTPQTTGIETR